MGATRIAILATAAIAAIGIALIVRQLANHRAAPPPPPAVTQVMAPVKAMTQVLVARRDLPLGTRLAAGDLGWQAWPAEAVNPVYITDGQAPAAATNPAEVAKAQAGEAAKAATAAVTGAVGPMEAIYGSIVKEPILTSEPITKTKLVRGGEGGFMAVVLRPGMRAVSVTMSVASAAGGFILPGDRVDVMQSHPVEGGHGGFTAGTLLRNVRVLAIDQTTQTPKTGQSLVGAVATLEVAAQDADVLVRAKAQGDVVLALRSYSDAGGPSGRGGVSSQDVGSVRIIRNGQPSEVMVSP